MRPKFFWNFESQTIHLISGWRCDLVIVNKKKRTYRIRKFAVPVDNRVKLKKKSEKRNNYLDLARELTKTMKNEGDGDTNEMHKLFWDFEIQTDHLISARRPDLMIINNNNNNNNKKLSELWTLLFRRTSEWNWNKYLDLVRGLKKLWNMKVTIIPITIGAFGTITKGLLKGLEGLEIRGRVDTIQITTLLRTVRIPRRVLETQGDLLSLKFQWKTIG